MATHRADKTGGAGNGPLKPTRVAAPTGQRDSARGEAPKRPFYDKRGGGGGGGGSGGGRGGAGGGGFGKKGGFRKGGPPFERRAKPEGFFRQLAIIHEDADILVVDKPPGLLSANMPGETRDSLFDQVKDHVKSAPRGKGFKGGGRGTAKVWIIHRLDKEASGLLVFAKSEKAFHWLKEDFKAKRVKRLYAAVIEGEIAAADGAKPGELPSGTIQSFIAEDEFGNSRSMGIGETARNTGPEARRMRWSKQPPLRPGETPDKPQHAVTHYRVLAMGQKRSLLQLRLDTGRKNQIRLHMKEFGHPIIGDRRFGSTTDPIQRVALHATDLGFTHPATGQPVRFLSPAPAAFYRAVGQQPPAGPGTHAEPGPALRSRAGGALGAGPSSDPVSETGTDRELSLIGSDQPAPVPHQATTSWDHVAQWYDSLVEEGKSDHFEQVIIPGTLHLLKPLAGMRVLDIACGQGLLCRKLAELGLSATGVDASPRLIESARQRAEGLPLSFEVADARELTSSLGEDFDAATCIMALMNIEPIEPVLRGAAALLKPGGSLIVVMLHPAFRAPGQTSWGWDEQAKGRSAGDAKGPKQFRRVDGYLSQGQAPITMNPGRAAHGAEPVQTWTFHRPLQTYVRALSESGFLIEALEEWPSQRTSQPGPRAAEENRARREIPMFVGIRAIKRDE